MKSFTSSQGYGSNSHIRVVRANNIVFPVVTWSSKFIFSLRDMVRVTFTEMIYEDGQLGKKPESHFSQNVLSFRI